MVLFLAFWQGLTVQIPCKHAGLPNRYQKFGFSQNWPFDWV